MIVSRITSKSPTVPSAVLDALGLKSGDVLAYAIGEDGRVEVSKASEGPFGFANPFANFTEWADPLDDAYDDL